MPDERPAPSGAPQQYGPDVASAVTRPVKSVKKSVKWNSKVEESETQAAWGGARRDMAVVRDKLGCKHDVSELYSPPRVVKMAKTLGM